MTVDQADAIAFAGPFEVPSADERADRDAHLARRLQAVVRLCSVVLFALGAAALVGWATGNQPLMSVLPGRVTMKVSTAICFVAAGIALALSLRPSKSRSESEPRSEAAPLVARFLALAIILCGGLTLVEYIAHVNLHIDELLFADPYSTIFPGRMAHVTAASFCLAGIALFLLQGGRRARAVAQAVSLLLATIAVVSIVGYLYGVPILYGSLFYTSMALHTGLGFLILGFSMAMARPGPRLSQMLLAPEAGGRLARRLLPWALILPIVLGLLYLVPAINFGNPRFGMALFAVTLVVLGFTGIWLLSTSLNRAERERVETTRVREQAAAAIKQSELELRLITDHLPTLICYLDSHERFQRVNRTYEQWLGLSAEKIVGRTIRELLGEDYWRRTTVAREAARSGRTVTVETAFPTQKGDRHAQVTYAPDFDEEGTLRGFACMVLDIHEYRQAESALRQSEKLAVVGRLASSIAHEINNPLEAVTNLLYLAALETKDPSDPAEGTALVAHYIEQAQQELGRVTHIVVQTLRFHRQATYPVLCRIPEMIEQILVLYQGRLSGARVVVQTSFREDAPLRCRDGEIRQVLANLIGNASDAMANTGGGRLLLRTRPALSPSTGEAGMLITVADTGHGIPPAVRAKLFEPFHSTKGASGSGLGLWVSKEIIERHGGELRIRSSIHPGRSGTVFALFLPHRNQLEPTS